MIPFELPQNIKAEIQGTPIPIMARGGDKLVWKFSPKGGFEMRSAYLLTTNSLEAPLFLWKLDLESQHSPKNPNFCLEMHA